MTGAAELASGKGHRDENFPVASWLVAPRHRAPIMAFYAFARTADDVADHPTAAPADKLARLDAMRATLVGDSDAEPTARALRLAQAERGLDARHGLDLLKAFRRDVTKTRYADWNELLDYCTVSAMPVGRFVLDVHGEDRGLWPANDALCAALQVVNHLQDCAKDHAALDRVYIPVDLLPDPSALAAPRSSPTLRAAILALAVKCRELLRRSAGFSRAIRDRRLGVEVAVIQRLAEDLTERLIARDPLCQRVHHRKAEAAFLAARAAIPRMLAR
jgi:squalene synthase HpnC